MVKIMLLRSASVLSLLFAAKTEYFVYLSFNSTLILINGTSSDVQKLLGYFNDTEIVVFLNDLA